MVLVLLDFSDADECEAIFAASSTSKVTSNLVKCGKKIRADISFSKTREDSCCRSEFSGNSEAFLLPVDGLGASESEDNAIEDSLLSYFC
jgi:hypothetical protein